jgi:hypothetical protein
MQENIRSSSNEIADCFRWFLAYVQRGGNLRSILISYALLISLACYMPPQLILFGLNAQILCDEGYKITKLFVLQLFPTPRFLLLFGSYYYPEHFVLK